MSHARGHSVDFSISYSALLEFAQRNLADAGPDITTEEVVELYVLPTTRFHQSSYAHTLSGQQVSSPTFHVVHSTAAKFSLIMDALKHLLAGADPDDVYLWIDVFSVNQHTRTDATQKDLDQIEAVIQAATGGTLLVLDEEASQLSRTWCLYEMWATLHHRGAEALHMLTPGFTLKDVAPAFMVVDVRQSQARYSPDRTKLLDRMGGMDGRGHRDLNAQIKLLYVLQPMDYKDLTHRLLQSWRFGTLMQRNLAKWMDKYLNWLELPTSHPNYKCFAMYGPHGCGKSMLCAGMCTVTADKLDLRPHAWHFTSSFNLNRVDPFSVIRTMAYQLALKIPETQPYLLNLDHSKVSKLSQLDQAFNVLIRIPLARLAREGKAPPHGVIFLIDGLDEAQQAGSNGVPELVSMMRDMFPVLPTFCRLVCTCRSEGEVPHIVHSLRAKLAPLEISPRDLLREEDMLMALEVQLNGVMEPHVSVPDAALRIFRRGHDNLLYSAVVLHGMHLHTGAEAHPWAMDELSQLPTDLPQAYAALFSAGLARLSWEERSDVKSLLQVLVAVREPLSLAHIHQIGLKHALKLLPGWGTLFYISHFKVQFLHKTLLDWLRRLDPELVSRGYAESWVPPSFKHHEPPSSAAGGGAPGSAPGAASSSSAAGASTAAGSPAAPAPPPPKVKRGMSVRHAAPDRNEAAGSGGGAEASGASPGPGRKDKEKEKDQDASGGGTGGGANGAGDKAAAAALSAQQQAAAAANAATAELLRLAGLLGAKQSKHVMTADMARGCELVLDVAQGHATVASILMEDIRSGAPHEYSLKHTVAHLCMCEDVERLEELLLDFEFWKEVYSAGFGTYVLRDLLELMPEDSAVAMDVGRWLRGVHKTLLLQPKAVLQLAADAPRSSHTSQAAMRFRTRPDGMLLNKEAHWSPNLMVLWEPGSGKITSIGMSPDGLRIAGGSTSKNVRLWDVKTGSAAGILEGPSSVFNCVAFFSDGSKLASGSADKTIRVWDAKSGETSSVLEGHKDNVTSVCISGDTTRLASGSADKTIRLWDLKLMEEVAVLEGHRDAVCSVSFTIDGSKVASGSGDRSVRLWDVKAKKLLLTMEGHFGVVYSVCCSPFSSHIASAASDKTIRIWDTESGQQVALLEGHQAGVTCVAYNPNGNMLASCSADKSFRVWDAKQFQLLLTIERQVGTFNSIAFAQDGAQVITASSDKTLRLWDAKTGEELALLEGHLDGVVSVAVAADGVRAASASLDKTVRTWDLKTEEQIAVFKGQSGVFTSVAFSPNGLYLATGSDDRTVRLWDAKTCLQVAVSEGHMDTVRCVAISPDNKLVASGSDDHTVKLWEVPSGAPVYTLNQIQIATGSIVCLDFAPDGTKLATGCSDTYKTVRQWDVQSGKQLTESKGHFGIVNAVAYSPDGSKIASAASDRTVRVWDASNGAPLQVLDGHEQAVTALSFCARTGRIASGSEDCSIRLWEHNGKAWAQNGQLDGHQSRVTGIVFHPDGTKLCSAAMETIRIWNVPRPGGGQVAARARLEAASHAAAAAYKSFNAHAAASPASAAAAANAAAVAATAAAVRRMSVTGASSQRSYPNSGSGAPPVVAASLAPEPSMLADDAPEPIPGHSGMINCIAFSPNGLLLATASYDKTIRLWDSSTGRVVTVLKGHSGVVNTVVWAPDGTRLASGGADETVRVWDARTGMELHALHGHSNWVRTVAFSPLSNKIISGSDAGEVRVWDVKSGQVLGSLDKHSGWVRCVAWSPEDTRVASCSEDRSIHLWDAKHLRIIHSLEGHSDTVTCIEFSPNGVFLASGSEDKSVRLWNCGNGRCLAEFKGHYGMITHVRFSSDSSLVSSSCADKVFRVWDTKACKEAKVVQPCSDGMWCRDLLMTVAADTGVISLWDGRSLQPLAQAYSTFNIRDVAFNGSLVACTTTGMGPEGVAVYRLNVPTQRSSHQHHHNTHHHHGHHHHHHHPAAHASHAHAHAHGHGAGDDRSGSPKRRSPSPTSRTSASAGLGVGTGSEAHAGAGAGRHGGVSSPSRATAVAAGAATVAAKVLKAAEGRSSPARTSPTRGAAAAAAGKSRGPDPRGKSPTRVAARGVFR